MRLWRMVGDRKWVNADEEGVDDEWWAHVVYDPAYETKEINP